MPRFTLNLGTSANVTGEISVAPGTTAQDLLRAVIHNSTGITVITENGRPLAVRNSAIILISRKE